MNAFHAYAGSWYGIDLAFLTCCAILVVGGIVAIIAEKLHQRNR